MEEAKVGLDEVIENWQLARIVRFLDLPMNKGRMSQRRSEDFLKNR